jgi:DNA polymerase III delta subunit
MINLNKLDKKKRLLDWFKWGKDFVEKNKLTKNDIDRIFKKAKNKNKT